MKVISNWWWRKIYEIENPEWRLMKVIRRRHIHGGHERRMTWIRDLENPNFRKNLELDFQKPTSHHFFRNISFLLPSLQGFHWRTYMWIEIRMRVCSLLYIFHHWFICFSSSISTYGTISKLLRFSSTILWDLEFFYMDYVCMFILVYVLKKIKIREPISSFGPGSNSILLLLLRLRERERERFLIIKILKWIFKNVKKTLKGY